MVKGLYLSCLLLVLVWGQSCPRYTCDHPSPNLDTPTCGYYNQVENQWYVKKCDPEFECVQLSSSDLTSNYTCQAVSPAIPSLSYPGEPCSANSDCYLYLDFSLGCSNSTCLGKTQGAICSRGYECAPGLTCIADQCILQKTQGESCISDLECVNTCGCDLAEAGDVGTCAPYFSLKPGETVQSCPGFQLNSLSPTPNVNYLCLSGSCVSNPNMCVSALQIQGDLPVNCTLSSSPCFAHNSPLNLEVSGHCGSCGYSGSQFCALFPGDAPFAKLIELTQTWLKSPYINQCNTGRRLNCMEVMDKSLFEQWNYYYLLTLYYPLVANAQKCVLEVMFPGYFQALTENKAPFFALNLALIALFSQ